MVFFICVFCYHAFMGLSYQVFTDHYRSSFYIDYAVSTLCAVAESFRPGVVYNIGGREYHDMKEVSDMILEYPGRGDELVEYVDEEPQITRDKKVDIDRAVRELGHDQGVSLAEGIPRTIEWMKETYQIGG